MSPKEGKLLGIDLGGTNVRVGVIDQNGKLLAQNSLPIEARRGPQAGLQRILQLIDTTTQQSGFTEIAGIGIGATGPVDRSAGAIQNPYTLPTWENVDIVSPLAGRYRVPVALENDADAAILGEYWCGAGAGVSPLFMLTIGTGIGSAMMIDGQLYRGAGGFHPEAGHMIVDPSGPACYCGAHGCLEILVAGPALARLAQERAAGKDTRILDLAGGRLEAVDAGIVALAAADQDALACELLDQVGYWLGLGIVNILRTFYPKKILLGGGGTRSYKFFQKKMQGTIRDMLVLEPDLVPIELAQLGEDAGMIGAAYAALKKLE